MKSQLKTPPNLIKNINLQDADKVQAGWTKTTFLWKNSFESFQQRNYQSKIRPITQTRENGVGADISPIPEVSTSAIV